ncbi:MAG: hypothetical protein HC939_24720 [Pleurocapsa sp. SU_5_0]|nr:hypothetical protein [Pleurocapsa sp. SU_5_0]NJO99241.1 hypothetical protein [Pleurocapsa sp. CRU_1_2]
MKPKFQDDKLSTKFGSLPQEAVDEAIEQHRSLGHAIAQTDDHGNVIEIQPEDITPLAEKLKQRQQHQTNQIGIC